VSVYVCSAESPVELRRFSHIASCDQNGVLFVCIVTSCSSDVVMSKTLVLLILFNVLTGLTSCYCGLISLLITCS